MVWFVFFFPSQTSACACPCQIWILIIWFHIWVWQIRGKATILKRERVNNATSSKVYMLHSNPKHIAKYLQKKYFQQLLAVKVFLYKYYMVTVLPVTIGKAFWKKVLSLHIPLYCFFSDMKALPHKDTTQCWFKGSTTFWNCFS